MVEQFHELPGEGEAYFQDDHTVCLSLAPRPVRFFQMRAGKTHHSLYGKGDMSIMPAEIPFFARWEDEDHYLQIRIAAPFMQQVAREACNWSGDRIELVPQFRTRDPQLESISLLLLNELEKNGTGEKLYIDSLTNIFVIHLLRHYATAQIELPSYKSGLYQHQLLKVLEYIEDHLDEDISLSDLAALLGISQFHFSRLFKQSIGLTPYQYLLQQRIERAKQLLKHTNQSIIDIAFLCGFNSHSHLTKQFRQITGVTPRNYRTD
jgi:AraC family transcriptional regulator